MNNPTICANIRSKLITKEDGLAIQQVNPDAVNTIHVQRCHSDTTNTAAIQKCITEPFGTQYGGTVAGVVTVPGRTSNKRFEVNTNTVGLIVTVRLTLINELNEEVTVTLTTNGTTYVPTAASNYKVLNDMVITSPTVLTDTQRVWCRAQSGTQNNIHYVVLGPTFKYNPVFMCGTKNGVVRNARLLGIPLFHSANTCDGLRLMVWANNAGTSAVKLTLFSVQGTRNNLLQDDVITLVPGEWCVFHRNTNSSVNTLVTVTALWELISIS